MNSRAEEHPVDDANGHSGRQGRPLAARPPVWEKILALVGLLVILGLLLFLMYQAIGGDDSPPMVDIRVDSVTAHGDSYLVRFSARNDGGQTAATLIVEGQLSRNGETVETSTAELDFLPARSTREGGLFFSQDPRTLALHIRAMGYVLP